LWLLDEEIIKRPTKKSILQYVETKIPLKFDPWAVKRALSSGADEYVMAVLEKLSDQDLLDDPTIAPLMAEAEEPTFLEYVAGRTSIEYVIADGVRFPSIIERYLNS